MFRKTNLLLLTLILSLGVFLAACSSGNGAETEADDDAQAGDDGQASEEEVTLQVWYRLGSTYKELFEETKEAFEEEHPNIKIEVNDVPVDQYVASVQAAVSGDELPDIFQSIPSIPLMQLVELGQVKALDDFITDDMRDEFVDGTWTEGESTLDGKIYGLPHHDGRGHTAVVFYNKDLLQEAGYDEDLPTQVSWEEFEEIARKSMEANPGTHGVTLSSSSGWILKTHLLSMAIAGNPEVSMSYVNPDMPFKYKEGTLELNNQGMIDAIEFLKYLDDEKIFHPNWLSMDHMESLQEFFNGEAAFTMQVSEAVANIPKDEGNYGVMHTPTKDGQPFYSPYAGEANVNWQVAESTENYEEVKIFLDFFMDYYYTQLLEKGYGDSPLVALNESVESDFELFNETSELKEEVTVLGPNPVNNNIHTIDVLTEFKGKQPSVGWNSLYNGYVTGEVTDLEGALEEADEEWNDVFTQAIETVNNSGKEVSRDDFTFEDWVPFEPYE